MPISVPVGHLPARGEADRLADRGQEGLRRDGTLLSFGAAEGEIIQVGRTLATIEIEDSGEEPERSLVGELESAASAELPPSREGRVTSAAAGAVSAGAAGADQPVTASPVARKLAAGRGIDLASVRGTGPGGRVLRKDIAAAGTAGAAAGGPPAASRVQPLSTLRRALAANMEKSNAIPSAVIHELVAVEELVRLRRELNAGRGAEGQEPRLSFLPFFLKFAALALREYPLLNAAYHPERQEVEQFAEVNLGVAVDTAEGLQVPVIQRADILSLPRIQAEVDRLAAGGAAGRHLHPHQLWGLRRAVWAAPDPASAGGHPGPGAHPRAAGPARRRMDRGAAPAALPGIRPPGAGRCVRRPLPAPFHGPGRAAAGVALALKREEVKGPGLHAYEPPANQTGIYPALFQPAVR